MVEEKLNKANRLQKSINKIEYFLRTIDPSKNIQRGSGKYDINVLLKKKKETKISYSFFGIRWFGSGFHEEEIRFPNELMDELYVMSVKKLELLNKELDSLFKH